MEIVKNEDKPLLYAVVTDKTPNGLMGLLIDSMDGAIIIRVNAETESQVKAVFGIGEEGESADSDDLANRAEIYKMLDREFQEGYEIKWVGLWRNDPVTVKLCAHLDGAKIEEDDLFDYQVPDRVIATNVEAAKKASYVPNPIFWRGDKSRDFYLGYTAAARVITALVSTSGSQKELLERLNKISLDSMILSDGKNIKNKLIL